MSRKHETFSLGNPLETAVDPNGKLVQVRDDLGLSLDPKEHADPKCGLCGGRGIVVKIAPKPKDGFPDGVAVDEDGHARFADTCSCVGPTYARRRKLLRPADSSLDLRYPLRR